MKYLQAMIEAMKEAQEEEFDEDREKKIKELEEYFGRMK